MTDSPSRISLLIADDSKLSRAALRTMLGDAWVIHEAEDGNEALAIYREHSPAIIMLDIQMPVRDGLSVIQEIRHTHGDTDTYIIALTSDEDPALHSLSLNIGANDFLNKPFRNTELMARLGVAQRQIATTCQLRGYTARIQQEIELVANLQQKLLPAQSPLIPGLVVESLYRPSGHASGDYFDYFALSERQTLRAIIADVSGHGARAAFIMGIVRTLFRMTQSRPITLIETVLLINRHLLEIIGTEEDYVTLICADLDMERNQLEYVNAGHCPGMLYSPGGETERLQSTSPLLGFFDIAPKSRICRFSRGSKLLLYTDGLFDWRLKSGKLFSFDRFWEYASSLMHFSGNYVDTLESGLAEIAGKTDCFRDDITALWIATV